MSMNQPCIVIVGGGFAGVKCARVLRRELPDARIVMFNKVNYMVFTPLLADVAGSSLNPRAVTGPLRQMLKGVHCRAETVTEVDLEGRQVTFRRFDGGTGTMTFDHLVLAVGNRVDLGRVPGMASHALPLKTIGDAIAMRLRVMERLEQADATEDPDLRRWLTSFVVIGGGFSGVEVAGEINDLARHALKYYPNVSESDIRVTLVHSRAEILPEVTSRLRGFALDRMQRNGVSFELESRAEVVTRQGVKLTTGEMVAGGTVVCTVGNTASELVQRLGVPTERGRILTSPDMRVKGQECLWAIGDCAHVLNTQDGQVSPPTAQFAERQGRQAARNIARRIHDQPTLPFRFKPVGVAAGIGNRKGVAELFGVKVSGFFAFWLWRSAFLVKLPSFLQKIKVGIDWAWELVFPRDLSAFSTVSTQPVTRNFFAAGETILDSRTVGPSLYAIESGECELVQTGAAERVLTVIGKGELIGRHTLDSFSEEQLALRARSNTEAISLAEDFLERMSGALKPVEGMLHKAMLTHKPFWHDAPQALDILDASRAEALMRPPPAASLDPQMPALQAFQALRQSHEPLAFVLDQQTLVGMVTRTDLISGLARGIHVTVGDVMTEEPAAACAGERCSIAASTMRDRGFKWMPVVRSRDNRDLVGLLHADDLVGHVLDNIGGARQISA